MEIKNHIKTNDKNSYLKSTVESLQRIVDFLISNNDSCSNQGLLNGRMGLAIFFYQYYRYAGDKIYKDFADRLIDEIYENINSQISADFESGLMGIGWGIEYLVKNNFIEAETDETLAEVDSIIYKSMIQSPVLICNSNDFFGYGLYFLSRLKIGGHYDKDLNNLIKKQILIYLIDECERLLIYKRYIDFYIRALSLRTINSLLFFLLEMHRLNLFPVKVTRLLNHMPKEIEISISMNNDQVEYYVLENLMKSVYPLINIDEYKDKYKGCIKLVTGILNGISIGNKLLININSLLSWYKLMYSPYLFTNAFKVEFSENSSKILNLSKQEDWDSWFSKININSGLAGIGLDLL